MNKNLENKFNHETKFTVFLLVLVFSFYSVGGSKDYSFNSCTAILDVDIGTVSTEAVTFHNFSITRIFTLKKLCE